MPISRKSTKTEEDLDEKIISIGNNFSPISIPLKQVFLGLMVIAFVYQVGNIYQKGLI